MPRIKVALPDGEASLFDGGQRTAYKVVGGEIVVDDAHVSAVLASFPGSELMPEAPVKETQETPAKKEK